MYFTTLRAAFDESTSNRSESSTKNGPIKQRMPAPAVVAVLSELRAHPNGNKPDRTRSRRHKEGSQGQKDAKLNEMNEHIVFSY